MLVTLTRKNDKSMTWRGRPEAVISRGKGRRLPLSSAVWICPVGVIVVNIAALSWVAARHEDLHFYSA